MNIYAGNLDFSVQENDLKEAFSKHGTVNEVRLITDDRTGRSKGFAFIEMPNEEEAKASIESLNGFDLKGREINVNEAKPRNKGGGGNFRGGNRVSNSNRGSSNRW
ncbi:RNA-binding protein [bacterium]|nr:RNA-binding protein [bacterium]